mgnify:FL=1
MKKILSSIISFYFATAVNAQRTDVYMPDTFENEKSNQAFSHFTHNCDSKAELADSVINFIYNSENGEFYPVEVRKYTYDLRNNLTEIHLISLPDRTNILRQVFEYDAFNNITSYTNYLWINSNWEKNLIVRKTYSSENKILTEVFYNRDAEGNFTPYMRHFYNYDGNRIVNYLRQIKNSEGQWYNFSYHYYIYDNYGRLSVLYGQYINGPVFWERTSVYDDFTNRLSQRYLRQLKFNPEIKQNVLTNITFEVYSYNIYGDVSDILYHGWSDNRWEVNGKAVFYYSLLKNKKVSICHNGNTLCVDAHAVKAHLEHGDKLGPCVQNNESMTTNKPANSDNSRLPSTFTLYPNPAKNYVTVKFNEDPSLFEYGMILSKDGKTIVSFNIDCRNEINLNIGNLREGTYIIKIIGSEKTETQLMIKK